MTVEARDALLDFWLGNKKGKAALVDDALRRLAALGAPVQTLSGAVRALDAAVALLSTFDGFDLFDDDGADAPAESEAKQTFRSLERGDVFKLGRVQWVVVRPLDGVSAMVYKYPSKGKKMYQIRAAEGDEYEVFQVGGSGQQMGPVVDHGPLKKTNVKKKAGLAPNGELA